MATAAAIVTSHGGRTCHAAIAARELGIPAVVGAEAAVEKLAPGRLVTVSCADGEVGKVYDGKLRFEVSRVSAESLPRPRTAIVVNLGNPELAFHTAMLPSDGVGLARMEFIINEHCQPIRNAASMSSPRRPRAPGILLPAAACRPEFQTAFMHGSPRSRVSTTRVLSSTPPARR